MRHILIFHVLLLFAMMGCVAACTPLPDKEEKQQIKAIQEYRHYDRKPVKKHAFGDCDSRDLANFTCE